MKPPPTILATWCAACLDDTAPLVQRPLGRNGGMVLVCPECDPGEVKPKRKRKGIRTGRSR